LIENQQLAAQRDTEVVASANMQLVRSIYAAWECGDFRSADWAHPKIEVFVARMTIALSE
jgi:hypothetical protein